MLSDVVMAYESEAAARARLVAHGYGAAVAAEIAVYLAQATDLPGHMGALTAAFAAEGVGLRFVALDEVIGVVPGLGAGSLLWCQTDGIRFYRGSSVAAVARLAGVARFGAPPAAQHLCQDKFATIALAAAAGVLAPASLLLEGDNVLGRVGEADWDDGWLFVKPNTLGAKLGIFADSRCRGMAAARGLAGRIWERYGDRAIVQPYVAGDDVRVSFLDTGGDFGAQLGVFRLARDAGSETGGDFMTMKDNETLSGAADTAGGRGGFGIEHAAAFVPAMADMRREAPGVAGVIEDAAARLVRLLGLTDLFSMDFRVDAAGRAHFLEFEVCPAVTIYDFQTYLRDVHGLALGPALVRSMRRAHARAGGRGEA